MTDAFKVVIPARLESTRLPGKVLLELQGRPVLQHVFDRAMESGASEVLIATDHEHIASAAQAFGAAVCMTGAGHESGTSRIEEVARLQRWADDDIVVNLQGDEPLMPAPLLAQAAASLAENRARDIATIAARIDDPAEWHNPNAVKVVCDRDGNALYFSRATIPFVRDSDTRLPSDGLALRHIGLYAYRVATLKQYCALPPCRLEQLEALEQLRALHAGMTIHVSVTPTPPPPGIDTREDLEAAVRLLRGQ